jgi:hypothetical protein
MLALRQVSKLWLAAPISLVFACGSGEERQTFQAGTDRELEQVLPLLRPGDVLLRGSIPFVVPPEGESRYMEILYRDGHAEELHVQTGSDGVVALVQGTPSVQAMDVHAQGAACSDGAYTISGHKWLKPLSWSFNAGTTPAELTPAEAETALRAAASGIATGYNDCGLKDTITAKQEYLGRTTRTATGCDGKTDGFNVVGFGDLGTGVLAVTCNWMVGKEIVESDLRINKVDHQWTVQANAPSCQGRFGLQAVMTHEFGHAFGLGHVAEPEHTELTMGTSIAACDASASTLGLGDVRALRALYP